LFMRPLWEGNAINRDCDLPRAETMEARPSFCRGKAPGAPDVAGVRVSDAWASIYDKELAKGPDSDPFTKQ
jgi:hypothetical protein